MWLHGALNLKAWPLSTLPPKAVTSEWWMNCLSVVPILMPELRALVAVSFYASHVDFNTSIFICLHSKFWFLYSWFCLLKPGTPLHIAAKERNRDAVKFLVENGAFLPPDINDSRFNPPLHYCPGLEWAYEEMKRLRQEESSLEETSCSSEN